jgi:pyruvate,water dikinase
MEKLVSRIEELSKEHVCTAGGKGANLGELSRKVQVPGGFVVLSDSFRRFVSYNDLQNSVLELQKAPSEKLQKKVSEKILSSPFPKDLEIEILENVYPHKNELFAVRSSAVFEDSKDASWAGQLETYTNIPKERILENVKKCWASLFSNRAVSYYHSQKNKKDIKMAVVVQEMVNADTSGICFSANPVSGNLNEIVIEAGWGLGESVVGGQITPDLYIVDKGSFEIKEKTVNEQEKLLCLENGFTVEKEVPKRLVEKQKLSDAKIKRLARSVVSIENHYGVPQDTEWAVKKNRLFFLQARPVTTISR